MATDLPAEQHARHECPICGTRNITKHCNDNADCWWIACQNLPCGAVLDNRRGRGHYLHPEGAIDKMKLPIRLRLIFDGGVWVDRDVA